MPYLSNDTEIVHLVNTDRKVFFYSLHYFSKPRSGNENYQFLLRKYILKRKQIAWF